MVVAGNTAKEVNIIEIGPQPPFKYHVSRSHAALTVEVVLISLWSLQLGGGRVGTMSIDIRADGPTTVVKLTDYDAETSLFKSADKPGMQTPNRPRESPSVPSAAGSDARAPTPSGDKVEDAFEAVSECSANKTPWPQTGSVVFPLCRLTSRIQFTSNSLSISVSWVFLSSMQT